MGDTARAPQRRRVSEPAGSGPAPAPPAGSATATPPALTLPPGGGAEAAGAVMAAVEKLAPGPDGQLRTTYRGQTLVLTAAQAERARATAAQALSNALRRSTNRSELAQGRFEAQEALNADFPVSSRAAKAWAYVRSARNYHHPGEALTGLRATMQAETDLARKELAAGHFSAAAQHVAATERASARAAALVGAYTTDLIEGAESLKTGLEYTSEAAFITLGVLAVVATGGAALGLAPEVIGTGVAGLSVSGTVTAISVGAPIVAGVGAAGVAAAYGDKVDWTAVAVDVAIQVILAKIGGKLGAGVFGKLAGNPATATVVRRGFASLGSALVVHEASQAFSVAVHQSLSLFRGHDVTWGAVAADLENRLTDPKGLFVAALMGAVHHGVHSKVAGASAGGSKPPPGGAAKPAQAEPAGTKPAIPAKPARAPASVTPPEPATAKPPATQLAAEPAAASAPPARKPAAPQAAAPHAAAPKPVEPATVTSGAAPAASAATKTSAEPPSAPGKPSPEPTGGGTGRGDQGGSGGSSGPPRSGGGGNGHDDLTFVSEGPLVRVPVTPEGTPASVLEIGAGAVDTNLGLPPEPGQANRSQADASLVKVTRSDVNKRPGVVEVNATKPLPPEVHGQDAVIVNNPRNYRVDIATLGEAVKPGGRIIIQGRAEVVPGMRGVNPDMTRVLADVRAGKVPPGYAVVEVVTDPTAPSGDPSVVARPPLAMGGPFNRTAGDRPVSWPNTRIVIEKLPAASPTPAGGPPGSTGGPGPVPPPSGPHLPSPPPGATVSALPAEPTSLHSPVPATSGGSAPPGATPAGQAPSATGASPPASAKLAAAPPTAASKPVAAATTGHQPPAPAPAPAAKTAPGAAEPAPIAPAPGQTEPTPAPTATAPKPPKPSATFVEGSGPAQPMNPSHARGYVGEQTMGFRHYRADEGWVLIEGPSGAKGHGVTNAGFDGVAYNTKTGELHLGDNKSLGRTGNVGSATAIDPSKNLAQNVDGLITRVEAMRDTPGRIRVLSLLKQTKAALANGTPLPAAVKLVVTSEGGRTTGVSQRLRDLGVEHRGAPAPATPTPTPAPPAATPPTTAPAPAPTPAAAAGPAAAAPAPTKTLEPTSVPAATVKPPTTGQPPGGGVQTPVPAVVKPAGPTGAAAEVAPHIATPKPATAKVAAVKPSATTTPALTGAAPKVPTPATPAGTPKPATPPITAAPVAEGPLAPVTPPRVGGRLRSVAGQAGLLGAGLLVGLLQSYLRSKLDQHEIEKDITRLWPGVERDLAGHTAEVAALQSQGRTAYANAIVHIHRARLFMPIEGAEVTESAPMVEKIEVRISGRNISTGESPVNKKWEFSDVFDSQTTLTVSFEVHLEGSP